MKTSKLKRAFQTAQRIQPDRRVKKKRKMKEPESFDIVGNFLYNYGMTGENLAHEIFSYLDFSSIQDSSLVSKPWNLYLSNARKLWMEILRQTQPYIQFLTNQLSNVKRSSHPLDRSVSCPNFDLHSESLFCIDMTELRCFLKLVRNIITFPHIRSDVI